MRVVCDSCYDVPLPYMETPSGEVDRRVLFFGLLNVQRIIGSFYTKDLNRILVNFEKLIIEKYDFLPFCVFFNIFFMLTNSK